MIATGYEPLCTLKPVADALWRIDGPAIWKGRVPYPTRSVVAKLQNGDLWVYSPTALTDDLKAELGDAGTVRHIVQPNADHTTHIAAWVDAFPDAQLWTTDSLQTDKTEAAWDGQLTQLVVRTGPERREAVFCHTASRTLIFADLFEALETKYLPVSARPIVWFSGTDDSSGGHMRPSHRWALKEKDKAALAEDIERIIKWNPWRIILSHGRCFDDSAITHLERAFRKVLRTHRWEAALKEHQRNTQGQGEP
jgi:hypothetical protein